MEDKRQYFDCLECGGLFSLEPDCSMSVEHCPFCGEPLEAMEWEPDYHIEDPEREI